MAEGVETEKLTRRNKLLEDKISKIRILASDELEGTEIKQSLARVQENLQGISDLSRTQQTTINCLRDELSAVKLIAAETQLRQLNEFETLTKELKEALIGQQQQPPADKHQHGMYFSI